MEAMNVKFSPATVLTSLSAVGIWKISEMDNKQLSQLLHYIIVNDSRCYLRKLFKLFFLLL